MIHAPHITDPRPAPHMATSQMDATLICGVSEPENGQSPFLDTLYKVEA
jgi:hypothetical protein